VLAGTEQARALVAVLAARPDLRVVSSLAGATAGPVPLEGTARIGGFGGPDGLAAWLTELGADALVDATHPFAAAISAAAHTAAAATGVPLVHLRRPGWTRAPGDRWHWVGSLAEAAGLAPALAGRVFLSTGRRGAAAFAADHRTWYLLRCIHRPDGPLPPRLAVVTGRGPFTVAGEIALLRRHRIGALVSKDSGGSMTSAKLDAARALGLEVVMVRRPPAPAGVPVRTTVEDVVRWLDAGLGLGPGPAPVNLATGSAADRPQRPTNARESGR
jgi:precorrin-6A/cobalt-precorrin-6A reductase